MQAIALAEDDAASATELAAAVVEVAAIPPAPRSEDASMTALPPQPIATASAGSHP